MNLAKFLRTAFIKNTSGRLLLTNVDIQPVFNYYKAVTYMCAYFSEGQPSEAGKQAAKEAFQ